MEPPVAPSAPGEGSPTVRGNCTRTSALSSGEWPPSRGLLSAASGPSWYFLLLTGRGSKSLPGPRQSPAWWLSPFCSWRGKAGHGSGRQWLEPALPSTGRGGSPTQAEALRCPREENRRGPGSQGARRGGAVLQELRLPPKRPPSRAECWVIVGGPEPCPQWRPASSTLGEPEALRGQATAPGPHSTPRGVQSARAHRSTWEQTGVGAGQDARVCLV